MGAYKDANGVTRAGKVLRDIGGFFSGIFKKKSTSTSTDTSNTNTGSSSGATPPISGNSSKFDWGGILVTLGTAVGGIFGVNTPTSDTNTTIDPSGSDPNNNGDASAKSLGTWVVVGIVSLVAGILIYVLYRKKAKA